MVEKEKKTTVLPGKHYLLKKIIYEKEAMSRRHFLKMGGLALAAWRPSVHTLSSGRFLGPENGNCALQVLQIRQKAFQCQEPVECNHQRSKVQR